MKANVGDEENRFVCKGGKEKIWFCLFPSINDPILNRNTYCGHGRICNRVGKYNHFYSLKSGWQESRICYD
jgi:hypothetical protein